MHCDILPVTIRNIHRERHGGFRRVLIISVYEYPIEQFCHLSWYIIGIEDATYATVYETITILFHFLYPYHTIWCDNSFLHIKSRDIGVYSSQCLEIRNFGPWYVSFKSVVKAIDGSINLPHTPYIYQRLPAPQRLFFSASADLLIHFLKILQILFLSFLLPSFIDFTCEFRSFQCFLCFILSCRFYVSLFL